MTKSFNTDMSFDNSINQIFSLKYTYIQLGCMPKFLQKINPLRLTFLVELDMPDLLAQVDKSNWISEWDFLLKI